MCGDGCHIFINMKGILGWCFLKINTKTFLISTSCLAANHSFVNVEVDNIYYVYTFN